MNELFDVLELNEVRHFYPDQLSLGLAQRASLARAFVLEPALLMVTHDIREAALLADRILGEVFLDTDRSSRDAGFVDRVVSSVSRYDVR